MLTPAQISELGDDIYGEIVLTFDAVCDRVKELEARIKQLELREQQVKYVKISPLHRLSPSFLAIDCPSAPTAPLFVAVSWPVSASQQLESTLLT